MKNRFGTIFMLSVLCLLATMPWAWAQQEDIKKVLLLELQSGKATRDHPLRARAEAAVAQLLSDGGWRLREAKAENSAKDSPPERLPAESAAVLMPADTPDIIVTFDLKTSEQSEAGTDTRTVAFHILAYNATTSAKIGEATEVSSARSRQPGEDATAMNEAIGKAFPRFAEALAGYAKRIAEEGFDVSITFNNTPEALLVKTFSAVRAVCGSARQELQLKTKAGLRLSYTGRCKLTGHDLAEALMAKIREANAALTPKVGLAVRQMVIIEF